jgi:hypothetical protein
MMSFSQGYFRLFFQGETFYRQTIIAFSDSTTDGIDNCCDAMSFGGAASNDIWTTIDGVQYVINSYSELDSDAIIELGVAAASPSPYYTIGVDNFYGVEFCLRILDTANGSLHPLPYSFYGEINPGRFFIVVEYPLSISVTQGCDSSLVTILNDSFEGEYILSTAEGNFFLPENSESLYLPIGDYVLTTLTDETCQESFSFQTSPTTIDATLQIPYTFLTLDDAGIIPVVQIETPYDELFWDFGDGSPFLYNDVNPVYFYSEEGNYTLRVIIRRGECYRIIEANITIVNVAGIDEVSRFNSKDKILWYGIDGRLQNRRTVNFR